MAGKGQKEVQRQACLKSKPLFSVSALGGTSSQGKQTKASLKKEAMGPAQLSVGRKGCKLKTLTEHA